MSTLDVSEFVTQHPFFSVFIVIVAWAVLEEFATAYGRRKP